MNQTIIAIIIFLAYWIIINMLKNRGLLEKYNITAHGPLLMLRTTKGQALLDSLAKPKWFWRLFANIGIPLMFIGMIAMIFILMLNFVSLFIVGVQEPGELHEPQNILLIPGINEFIPFTWGIIALIIALVAHEFSHAILAKVESVKVKSMGILLALIPIGGFAELDEEAMFRKKDADKKDEIKPISLNAKSRIFAAGVMSNFVITFFALLLLFGPVLSGIAPVDNAVIGHVDEDSPSFGAGLRENMMITQINDNPVQSISDIVLYLDEIQPGTILNIHTSENGVRGVYNVRTIEEVNRKKGVFVQSVVPDTPAENAGIKAGMSILKIDGRSIQSPEDFLTTMRGTKPNQIVMVDVLTQNNEIEQFNITLADRNGIGFLGVSIRRGQYIESLGLTLIEFPAETYLNHLKEIPSNLNSIGGWFVLLALPIISIEQGGFPGFNEMLMQFYEPIGWAEPIGIGIFWMANILLWTGWLNFSVGLFNCLPTVPLDGGHLFKGYFELFIKKIIRNDSLSQSISGVVTGLLSVFVLLSFIFMIFGPFIVHGF